MQSSFCLPRSLWEIALLFEKQWKEDSALCAWPAGTSHHTLPERVGKRYVNAEVTVRLVDTVHTQPQGSRIATTCCKCKDCKKLGRTKQKLSEWCRPNEKQQQQLPGGLKEVMVLLTFGSGWKMKAMMGENREVAFTETAWQARGTSPGDELNTRPNICVWVCKGCQASEGGDVKECEKLCTPQG